MSRQISALQVESELLYFRKHHGVPGVLAAVCLVALSDTLKACNSLVRYQKWSRASAAARHLWVTFQRLFATGLASRPTR